MNDQNKKESPGRISWRMIRQFIQIAHEYWLPVSNYSSIKFLLLVTAMIFLTGSLLYGFVVSLTFTVHYYFPGLMSKYVPGLFERVEGIANSWITLFFIGAFAIPFLIFICFYRSLKGRIKPWLALLSLLLLSFTVSGLNVVITYVYRFVQNAIFSKNLSAFWTNILILGSIFIIAIPIVAMYPWIRKKLYILWREWMTERVVDKYLNKRAYYEISSKSEIDNPDQRISEDIRNFTSVSLTFLLIVLGAIIDLVSFSGVLWSISRMLAYTLILYAVTGTILTIIIGRPQILLNYRQSKKEADFRYGMVHIRDNTESIAFYRGENKEKRVVFNLFKSLFTNYNILISWQRNLDFFTATYKYLIMVLPLIILVPMFIAGSIKEFGEISQADMAFSIILGAFSIIVDQFESISAFTATIERVAGLNESVNMASGTRSSGAERAEKIKTQLADTISVESVTLKTPDYSRTLIKDLSFSLKIGRSLLIVGPSGVGKSSLLRAIAGLWNSGTGIIRRPDIDKLFFLPQKPYMLIGSLRQQIIYPADESKLTDAELNLVLEKVNLAGLIRKISVSEGANPFDMELKWDEYLSLGEQQRLAFARVLLAKPDYVILDEATSALDVTGERFIYSRFKEERLTYISVGHRPTLVDYHDNVLVLSEDGTWKLLMPEEFRKIEV